MMENKIVTKRCLEVVDDRAGYTSDAKKNVKVLDDNNNVSEAKCSEKEAKDEEPMYDYLGIKFKSPVKWINTISIRPSLSYRGTSIVASPG